MNTEIEKLPEDVVPLPQFPPRQPKEIPVSEAAQVGKDPGNWNTSGHGSPAAVIKMIEAQNRIPAVDREYLAAKVRALSAEFNHLELHAHSFVAKGITNIHISLKPSKRLE